ncbi:hypothetical protein B7494_g1802 [Chlorociboria aeruginascens]|nr:hypothetical protein B7494_g1802 [Chlorociboria aeruginascens]
MNLFDRLHQKLELFRLEQRYTRRRNRCTFISAAQYVDGEYIYSASPSYSTNGYTASSDGEVSEKNVAKQKEETKETKTKKRASRMNMDWKTSGKSTAAEKRQSRVVHGDPHNSIEEEVYF